MIYSDVCYWIIVICSAARRVPFVYLADAAGYVANRSFSGLFFDLCVGFSKLCT